MSSHGQEKVARFQAVVKGTGPLSRLPYGFRACPVGDLAGRDGQVIGRAKPAGPQFVIGSPRRREQLLRFRVLGEFSGQDQGGLAAQGRKKPRAGLDQLQAVLNFFAVDDRFSAVYSNAARRLKMSLCQKKQPLRRWLFAANKSIRAWSGLFTPFPPVDLLPGPADGSPLRVKSVARS